MKITPFTAQFCLPAPSPTPSHRSEHFLQSRLEICFSETGEHARAYLNLQIRVSLQAVADLWQPRGKDT
jgi:hypothetical protein